MRFIDTYKDHRVDDGLRWGVEPICAVLCEHGCPIAPSTYYEARGREGKSHIAQALGHLVIRHGGEVRFAKASRALASLGGGPADRAPTTVASANSSDQPR